MGFIFAFLAYLAGSFLTFLMVGDSPPGGSADPGLAVHASYIWVVLTGPVVLLMLLLARNATIYHEIDAWSAVWFGIVFGLLMVFALYLVAGEDIAKFFWVYGTLPTVASFAAYVFGLYYRKSKAPLSHMLKAKNYR